MDGRGRTIYLWKRALVLPIAMLGLALSGCGAATNSGGENSVVVCLEDKAMTINVSGKGSNVVVSKSREITVNGKKVLPGPDGCVRM
jgi:hypothetical protein